MSGLRTFRSFDDFEINLGQFNVVVGANASGKSNLLQVFRFIEDIADHGLKNAISLQGGVDFLTNVQIGRSRPLSVKVTGNVDERFALHGDNDDSSEGGLTGIRIREVSYYFSLEFPNNEEFDIVRDELEVKGSVFRLTENENEEQWTEQQNLGKGSVILRNADGKVNCDLRLPKDVPLTKRSFLPPAFIESARPSPVTLLLERHFFHHPVFYFPAWKVLGADTAIYDFDSRQPKKAVEIAGKSELESDGSNLALVMRKIIEDDDKHRRFRNLLQYVLPYIEDLDVDTFADKWLLMRLKESYAEDTLFPATFISDGTINVISLIVALYFDDHSVVMIEEPEQNMHPHLISRVVLMLKDRSEKKAGSADNP